MCGCLYVHFETISNFTRNKQMGCSEAFHDNGNGAKHPRNVTSHFGTPRNVSGENTTRSEKSKNVQKIAKIEGYNARFTTF